MTPPLLVLTPGDPEGIGPEITWKAIQSRILSQKSQPLLCIGAPEPFRKMKIPVIEVDPHPGSFIPPKTQKPYIWLLAAPENCDPGKLLPGYQCGWSIQKATELVLNGSADALVTGPISKERLQKGGYFYPGHTEFLADLCKTNEVTMMLANKVLRVSLVTTHLALRDVAGALNRETLRRAVLQTVEGLRILWKIGHPKVAVAALNPHAGEAGLFGREEIEILEPEIRSLNLNAKGQFEIFGPLPADTLFAKQKLTDPRHRFDAVVCMYHDQGLIPVKLLDFHRTVNVTLGLPIVRTSVDHGVGFDIVGKGIANPSSLCAAIRFAAEFVRKRRSQKPKA